MEFIEGERDNYPLRLLLYCMKVSRTAYYAWAARSARLDDKERRIRVAVKEKFYFHKRRYGSRRVSDELKEEGVKAGRYLVTRVMREEGLVAKYPKPFKPRTTDSRHTKTPSPNLLKELENTAFRAGEAIVGDITYLPLAGGGFCYLAMFQDKVTKRIVGWSLRTRMTAELVTEALRMALRRGFVKWNAIVHTDRGSQYASNEYRTLLSRCGLRQSMSAKGNCYDNAQAESFFSRFKTEIDVRIFSSAEEARHAAFDYIDCYYNRIRRHSAIGCKIPEFEKRLREQTSQGCGNAAHVEIAEKQLTFSRNSHNRLEKPKNAFPTFPQPRLLDIN
jgi:transposase InsO family protein